MKIVPQISLTDAENHLRLSASSAGKFMTDS